VNIPYSTVVLSAELLEEKVVPMGQPEEIPVVVGYADDEDEEDEDDEELDDEDLDHEWEEVVDDDDDDKEEDEEEDEE